MADERLALMNRVGKGLFAVSFVFLVLTILLKGAAPYVTSVLWTLTFWPGVVLIRGGPRLALASTKWFPNKEIQRQELKEAQEHERRFKVAQAQQTQEDEVARVAALPKTCPDCAESVLPAAKVCKHCGYRWAA